MRRAIFFIIATRRMSPLKYIATSRHKPKQSKRTVAMTITRSSDKKTTPVLGPDYSSRALRRSPPANPQHPPLTPNPVVVTVAVPCSAALGRTKFPHEDWTLKKPLAPVSCSRWDRDRGVSGADLEQPITSFVALLVWLLSSVIIIAIIRVIALLLS